MTCAIQYRFEKVSQVWVSVVKVLTVNVVEDTNEEKPNFAISFKDDLAVLQASVGNKLQRNWKELWSQSQMKDVFAHKLVRYDIKQFMVSCL